MADSFWNRWGWRGVLAALLFVVVSYFVGRPIVEGYLHKHHQTTAPAPAGAVVHPSKGQHKALPTIPPVSLPTVTTPATTRGGPAIGPGAGSKRVSDRMAAVQAAAYDLAALHRATFYNKPQLQAAVNQYVVRPYRSTTLAKSLKIGPMLAKEWGYKSTDEANSYSQTDEHTIMYRVDSFTSRLARIRLYVHETQIEVSPQLRELALSGDNSVPARYGYTIPRIVIVTMYKYNGKWWYCFNQDAPYGPLPKGGQPVPKANLGITESEARFQSYLQEGFQYYEPTS